MKSRQITHKGAPPARVVSTQSARVRAQKQPRSPALAAALRISLSVFIAFGFILVVPAALGSLGGPQVAQAASDPVVAAAGDIACDPADTYFNGGTGSTTRCHEQNTSNLLVNGGFAAVLALGDNQYYCASLTAFKQSYDPTWGRIKSLTRPVPGNHEYLTSGGTGCTSSNSGATGYFNYFGSAAGTPGKGYYSYDIGTWHIIALNSNCADVGGCNTGSPQYTWLQNDLATHANYCTLAYWHIPLFSSGGRAAPNSRGFWNLLYNYNADVILNGHDHIYERFTPQDPNGAVNTATGIRQFTVGTGGNSHTGISTLAAHSQVRNTDTFGVLKLTLHATSYTWQFVPESGKTFTDSGTTSCHDANTSTATPTRTAIPTATLTATPVVGATSTNTATPTPTAPGSTNTPTATPTTATIPTATATSATGQSTTFVPQADAYVNSGFPTTNFGTLTTLRVDASPDIHSYIRFNVSGLNGAPITRVQLRIFANSASTSGLQTLTVVDNTWGETTVNYSNAPVLGSTIATSGAVTTGAWVTLDVTSYVTAEGTYSFGVTTPGGTAISLASRESGPNAPQLIVDLGP